MTPASPVELQAIADGKAVMHAPRPRLVPIPWSEIHRLPKRGALVSGIFDRGAMSVVFGGSNVGKTFLVLDISACIALAWPWRGRKVCPGTVAYIAVEGGLGIEERLSALRSHHGIKPEGVPLYVIPEPIDLGKPTADTNMLLERLSALPPDPPLQLIVIDTLSRALAGGNENSPDDMGAFVRNCDRLRAATGAHVLVIHHAGKDDARGARGHSLLRGAVDTEIEITRNDATGIATATVVKQRDHASGDVFGFKLEPVEIGQDEEGKPITSCVVTEAEGQAVARRSKGRPNKGATIAARALAEALDEIGTAAPASAHIPANVRVVTVPQWRDYAYRSGLCASDNPKSRQTAFNRALEHLLTSQSVGIWNEQVWLNG